MKITTCTIVALVALGCGKKDAPTAEPSAAAVSSPAVAPAISVAPPPPKRASPIDEIQQKTTFAEALAYAKPLMGDAVNNTNPGALVFVSWAAKRMKWSDVAVKDDETTPKQVMKDSDEERGKRLCFTGKIIQIAVEKLDFGKVTNGILQVGYYDTVLWKFLNVGSSGSIVEDSQARFCGVVIGRYDYSNSGGGTGHAIQVVGMWDLPENKPPKGSDASAPY